MAAANLLASIAVLCLLHKFRLGGEAPPSLPFDVFSILLGYLVSQRAQSAFDRLMQAQEKMSKLRTTIVNFVTSVEHWNLAKEPKNAVHQQQLVTLCREDLAPFLYYRYRCLCCKAARTEEIGKQLWHNMEERHGGWSSRYIDIPKSWSEEGLNAASSTQRMGVFRTMIMVYLIEVQPVEVGFWNQIEEAFREAEDLACRASMAAGRILSWLTTLSVSLLSISLPIGLYPTMGLSSWLPLLVIIPIFSALDTFGALAENPFDDHVTDINLFNELMQTVREIQGVERVVNDVLEWGMKEKEKENTSSTRSHSGSSPESLSIGSVLHRARSNSLNCSPSSRLWMSSPCSPCDKTARTPATVRRQRGSLQSLERYRFGDIGEAST